MEHNDYKLDNRTNEDILKDILAVDPEESGIYWEDMTERERENLRQECRDMLKYSVFLRTIAIWKGMNCR